MPPLPSALTSSRPSAHNTAFCSALHASWRLALTLGRPSSGPSQGACCHSTGVLGLPSHIARFTLSPGCHMGPLAPTALSVQEKAQSPPSPWRHLKASHDKALGPMPLFHRDHTTTHHSVHCTAFHLVLRTSWGLNLTLCWPPWGPSQVAWQCNTAIGDSQAAVPDSPCHQATTRVNRGPAAHSGLG